MCTLDKKKIINLLLTLRLLRKYYSHAFNLDKKVDKDYLELVDDLIDLKEVQYMKKNIQHSDITTFEHTLCVSYIAYKICKILGWNFKAAARAGLLHDLVYYDWHDPDPSHRFHGYRHPGFAVANAKEITELSDVEEDIIQRHMWPLTPTPPRFKESWVVTLVDKYCATKETMRKYKKQPENYRSET